MSDIVQRRINNKKNAKRKKGDDCLSKESAKLFSCVKLREIKCLETILERNYYFSFFCVAERKKKKERKKEKFVLVQSANYNETIKYTKNHAD